MFRRRMCAQQGYTFGALIFFAVNALASIAGASASPSPKPGPTSGPVTEIRISGAINPGTADYIRSAIRYSEGLQAQALILVLNTPGGLLSSTRDIVQAFSQSRVPIVVFVSPGGASATSAGAVISVAAHLSAMAPGTNLGAAHPVGSGGEDIKSTMGEKVTNDTAALMRAQAVLRHRNAAAAEKIVTHSQSFTSEEAIAEKIVNFAATDVDSLLRQLDQQKVFVEGKNQEVVFRTATVTSKDLILIPMSWSQSFLQFVADPNISTSLLTLAGIAFYVEVASGFSALAPGVVGLVLGLLAAVSLSMLPINLAGVLLFVLGLGFFMAEIFVTSFGVLFIAGIFSTGLGAMFLMDPNASSLRVSYAVIGPLILAFVVVGGIIAWLVKKDRPSKPLPINSLIGLTGHVLALDDSDEAHFQAGQVKVMGEIWNFISHDSLAVGDEIEVISRQNLQLNVKRRKK